MTRFLVLTAVCIGLADRGYAQDRAVVEIGGGAGYVFGGGAEDPGPSLAAFDAIVSVWPFERWGVGVRWVEGPGEDLHPPIESGDRAFLGTGHLRYWVVTARHRRRLPRQLGFELGFGMLYGGEFASIQELRNPPRRITASDSRSTDSRWMGSSVASWPSTSGSKSGSPSTSTSRRRTSNRLRSESFDSDRRFVGPRLGLDRAGTVESLHSPFPRPRP